MRVHSIITTALVAACLPAFAQLSERPGTSIDQTNGPKDLSGLSLKTPRTRIVHTDERLPLGGSWSLINLDPFLAWKMGKDLTQREFKIEHGVFSQTGAAISGFRGTLPDGLTPAITANDQVSCGGCHNMPYRDAGAGTNFSKKSGVGRNATHFFGSGIQEMLAYQIRQKMMQQMDTDRNGMVDLSEMNSNPILVEPTPGAPAIDYGTSSDTDADGRPDLNNIFRVWYLDSNQEVVDGGDLNDPAVAGFDFVLEVFGWGEIENNLNTTNRVFIWDPFNAHGGLEAYDPSGDPKFDTDNDGWVGPDITGLVQTWIGHIPPDRGDSLNAFGLSLDDPDGDGYINEISEGDLDMVEWYMLNSPRPGMGRQTPITARGDALFDQMQCNSCHVSEWLIEAADPDNPDIHKRYLGDLRFFDIEVQYDEADKRLEGELVKLYDINEEGEYVRHKGSFLVSGIGTDFKHWEMGPALHDTHFDGTVVSAFRTGLMWGNGATGFPWGHDGLSMTLDDIIRRHGGAAQASTDLYLAASPRDQLSVVEYIRSHLLYPTDQTPMDIDGDGVISENFMVAGMDTGTERFNPEWLFRIPGQIEGSVTNPQGDTIRSDALVNLPAAYGLNLAGLRDDDEDGFANIQDACPATVGYKDGCVN